MADDRLLDQAHQELARWRKAAHMLAAAYKYGVPVDRLIKDGHVKGAMSEPALWEMLAGVSGVNKPSVVSVGFVLEALENVRVPDPKDDEALEEPP